MSYLKAMESHVINFIYVLLVFSVKTLDLKSTYLISIANLYL